MIPTKTFYEEMLLNLIEQVMMGYYPSKEEQSKTYLAMMLRRMSHDSDDKFLSFIYKGALETIKELNIPFKYPI